MATLYSTKTSHKKNGVEVTDPITLRIPGMSRKEWRNVKRVSQRAIKRQRKARLPESVKLDRRLHAVGLLSPRDVRVVRGVTLYPKVQGV